MKHDNTTECDRPSSHYTSTNLWETEGFRISLRLLKDSWEIMQRKRPPSKEDNVQRTPAPSMFQNECTEKEFVYTTSNINQVSYLFLNQKYILGCGT